MKSNVRSMVPLSWPACSLCNGTGEKDHAEPCDHVRPAHQTEVMLLVIAMIGPMTDTPRDIKPAALLADLGLDDLDRDVMAMELGDAIGIHIRDEDARRWQSVQDIIDTAEKVSG